MPEQPLPARPRRRTARRLLVSVLLALLGLQLLYVVGANLLLRSHALEKWVTGDGRGQELKYANAWSWWPGKVHVEALRLRVEDSTVQVVIYVPRAELDVKLHQLARRTFHVGRAEIEGLRFHLRFKVLAPVGIEQRLEAWPSVPGRPDPPLTEPTAVPGPQPDKMWGVHLQGVHAQLEELWIAEYRYQGPGEARGAFQLRPLNRIEVSPSTVSLHDGRVTLGGRPVAHALHAAIGFSIERYDPIVVQGKDVLRRVSADVKMHGALDDFSFASVYVPAGSKLQGIEGGQGPFEAAFGLEHGRILPTTRVAMHLQALQVLAGPVRAVSDVNVQVAGGDGAEGKGGAARVQLPSVRLWATDGPQGLPPAVVQGVELEAASRDADLTLPWELARAKVVVAGADAHARWLEALMGKPRRWELKDGNLHAGLGLHLGESGGWSGAIDASARELQLDADSWSLRGAATVHAPLRASRPDAKKGTFHDVTVAFDEVAFSSQRSNDTGWWGRAEIKRLRWEGLPPRLLEASVQLRAKDAQAILKTLTGDALLPHIAIDAVGTSGLQASGKFKRTRAGTEVELRQARTRRVGAAGRWAKRPSGSAGAFLVESVGQVVGVGLGAQGTDVRPGAGQAWLQEQFARRGL